MKGTITLEGDKELGQAFSRLRDELKPEAVKELRSTSLAVMGRIKREMPVDSGRARASWGQWTSQDIVKASPEAGADDAHWQETDGGLTIEQGSNVPYIKELNEGHSQQRAAGFIDVAFKDAQRLLLNAINDLLDRIM